MQPQKFYRINITALFLILLLLGCTRGKKGLSGLTPTEVNEYRSACEAEDAPACLSLANVLIMEGGETEANFLEIERIWRKACGLGSGEGCDRLGYLLMHGHPVFTSKTKGRNIPEGLRIRRKACDDGYLYACVHLGQEFEGGEIVKKDLKEAEALYRHGCEKGEERGCELWGLLYWLSDYKMFQKIYGDGCHRGMQRLCEFLKTMTRLQIP